LKQLRCVIIKIPNDLRQLVLPNLKRFEEDTSFYDEENVRFSSPKAVETFFCQEFVTC